MDKKDTSWGSVADWYADHLSDEDTLHNKVILPNIMRVMDIKSDERIIDVACGSGFFSREFVRTGAKVMGFDISHELVQHARTLVPKAKFDVAPADALSVLDNCADKASLIMAIQNIREVDGAIAELNRVLVPGGKAYLVMNHPAFRIPGGSTWGWDDEAKKQYRRVDLYMSELKKNIQMHPGADPDNETVTFHRPFQYYFKIFRKNNFAVTRLEEWISHRVSEKGPRQKEEDRIRKEVPLFLMIEIQTLKL